MQLSLKNSVVTVLWEQWLSVPVIVTRRREARETPAEDAQHLSKGLHDGERSTRWCSVDFWLCLLRGVKKLQVVGLEWTLMQNQPWKTTQELGINCQLKDGRSKMNVICDYYSGD